METVHIFKTDKKTIDTQKVTFSIWKNRANADFVRDFTETLSKFVEEKRVFNEIEFYLPQLAHLIIHLNIDWPSQSLERLAIVLSQTSIHTALQLCFMFIAAMEDYQPENADGKINPNANLEYYLRCSRLLHDVERTVIFGSPSLSADYSSAPAPPVQVTGTTIIDSSYKEKNLRADEILQMNYRTPASISSSANKEEVELKNKLGQVKGSLLYKRNARKSRLATKSWKTRYFKIEEQILLCYRDSKCKEPLRAIAIEDFELFVVTREKYDYQFELYNKASGLKYQLRASDEADYNFWIKGLKREADRTPRCVPSNESGKASSLAAATSSSTLTDTYGQREKERASSVKTAAMSAGEKKRFEYFQQQRIFIGQLTEICEKLRFIERPVRAHFLRRDMTDLVVPPFCYLPLCRSVDTWRYVLRTLPLESHAFNTKARCPALMLFEVEEYSLGDGRGGSDVATFLGMELHEYDDSSIPIATGNGNTPRSFHEASDPTEAVERQQSLFSNQASSSATRLSCWRPEGTGILRIKERACKAAAIPPQSPLNNPALREIQRDTEECLNNKLPSFPVFQQLSIMKGGETFVVRVVWNDDDAALSVLRLFWCSSPRGRVGGAVLDIADLDYQPDCLCCCLTALYRLIGCSAIPTVPYRTLPFAPSLTP